MAVGIRPPGLPPGIVPTGVDMLDAVKARRATVVQKPAAKPAKAPTPAGPGIIETAFNMTEGALNIIAAIPILSLPVMLASGVVSLAGKGLQKVPYLTSVQNAGKAVTNFSWKISAPIKFFETSTFAEVGDRLRVRKPVGSFMQGAADFVAARLPAENRFTKWRMGKHYDKAHNYIGEIKKLGAISEIPAELTSHFDTLTQLGTLGHARNADTQAIHSAIGSIEQHVEEAARAGKNLKSPANMHALLENAKGVAYHADRAHMYSNVKDAVKHAPSALAKAPIAHHVTNAAWTGASLFGTYRVASGLLPQIQSLRQMYSDVTGVPLDKVSTFKVLLGKVPDLVADARKGVLASFGVRGFVETAWLALNTKNLVSGRSSKWMDRAQFGMMFADMFVFPAISPESSMPIFQAVHDAYANKQEIPVEAYAAFIGEISRELRARGGAESRFSKALAKQYAEEKASPAHIIQEINDGRLHKRIESLMEAAKTHHATTQASHVTHASALATKERPVVGEHTEKLAARDAATQGQSNAPGVV